MSFARCRLDLELELFKLSCRGLRGWRLELSLAHRHIHPAWRDPGADHASDLMLFYCVFLKVRGERLACIKCTP